jgi:hypothetical protein
MSTRKKLVEAKFVMSRLHWIIAAVVGALVLIFFWEPTCLFLADLFTRAAHIFGKH